MSQPWWEVLQIPRDSDRAAKRRAYAARLKVTNPEDDPQGFMALREAYEAALAWIEYDDWDDEDAWDDEAPIESPASESPLPFEPTPKPAEPSPEPPIAAAEPIRIAPVPEPLVARTMAAEPESPPDPHDAERDELRGLTAALEAGLRGPWFKGETELKFYLSRILASPALIELDTRDAIEGWLADLLADTVPRSDRLLLRSIEAFAWEQEGERPPAVWRILGRIDEWRLMHSLNLGEHELSAGWQALTRAGQPDWRRRLSALRPDVVAKVRQLFDLADYQTPGIVHTMDAGAAAWWREHLAQPRFGFIDLAVVIVALAVLLPIAILSEAPAIRWVGAAAVLAGTCFPVIRLKLVAPWRERRDADYAPPDVASHGWTALWLAALLLLIWTPAGPWMAALTVALSASATLWMAVMVGREPRIGNPTWQVVSFGALALVGGFAFIAMPSAAQAALAAFAIASVIIVGCGAHAIAELLWRVGEKPVLAAAVAAGLLIAAAAARMALPVPPVPLLPWGSAAIGAMVLTIAVRDVHDGSVVVRFMPLLPWALWIALVASAILSTPEERPGGPPPVYVGAADSVERIEPGFAALKTGNPQLYAAVEAVRKKQGASGRTAAWREIDRLVNAAYRERLPTAPTALIAAEMEIRLATMREQQQRDPASCAGARMATSFEPSEDLRKRHYRHALTIAGTQPETAVRRALGKELAVAELYRLAADGDATRSGEFARAMAGMDAKAKCTAQIAVLKTLVAQPDIDIAKTMRPALIERAAKSSPKK